MGLWVIFTAFTTFSFLANADEISEFIESSYVPVYDCPSVDVIPIIDKYLNTPTLTQKQKRQLTVRKTHAQICTGNASEAKNTLQHLLADDEADRSEKYYTAAIYQYAFIYDLQENAEKCNYYRLARDTGEGRFNDIYASATLAYLTDCSKGIALQSKMSGIYDLLESITKTNDKAAIAHAHNRVGLFYATLGASSLSATQYLKAYEIGKEIYTYENQVPLLTSAMTALILSEDYKKAKEVLIEFREVVSKAQSASAQFYLLTSEASLYISTRDYQNLEKVVEKWKVHQQSYSTSISAGLFRWHTSVLCLHNEDRACLQAFVEKEKTAPKNYLSFIGQSREYLLFMTEVYIFLEDFQNARTALRKYSEKMSFIQNETQSNARNIGTLNLHSKIQNLESELQKQETVRVSVMLVVIAVLIVIALTALWFLRRKHLESKCYDSATGLLNNTAVINKIKSLPAPGESRTNALAIFDIGNFTEVNLSLGSGKSDYLLSKLANTFRKITRSSDVIGRFGPGQFILCLTDIEEDAAQAFFERAKEALSNTFRDEHKGEPISVDSSMSIYYESGTFNDINDILDNMLLSLSMKSDL